VHEGFQEQGASDLHDSIIVAFQGTVVIAWITFLLLCFHMLICAGVTYVCVSQR